MESSDQQELINRNEEFDDSLGVGRSYECVFCKRGFNTAQALGGHMNIHRRDKVKNNKSTSTNYLNKLEEEKNHHQFSLRFSCYGQNMPASSSSSTSSSCYNHDHVVYDHDDHRPRSTYNPKRLPGSTSYFRDDHQRYYYSSNNNGHETHDYELDQQQRGTEDLLVHGDWDVGLSLDYNSTILKDRAAMMSQKEDLDLELRLGL